MNPLATDLGPTPILGARRFRIWSKNVEAYFIIDIAMPGPAHRASGPVPVLFVTDGNLCFGSAAGLAGAMATDPKGPPAHCVVGIGYEVSGNGEKAEHHVIRTRDLTPCEDKRFEAMMRRAPAPYTWRDDIQAGGAAAFLAFILEELSPWLVQRFDVDLAQRTLAGISLGGLFVLNTAFTHPRAFQGYIAISPAIWWADRFVMALEEETAEVRNDVKMTLFMAVGALEEAEDAHAKTVSNLIDLAGQMERRALPGLKLVHDVLPGQSHRTVFSPAFISAMRKVFPEQDRDESWAQL